MSWLDEILGAVEKGVGIFQQAKNPQPQTPVQNPVYNPNIVPSDFAFAPYYPLMIGGGVILILALVISRR